MPYRFFFVIIKGSTFQTPKLDVLYTKRVTPKGNKVTLEGLLFRTIINNDDMYINLQFSIEAI